MQFKFTRLRELKTDLILVPLESAFGTKPRVEQQWLIDRIGKAARDMQMPGVVILVWDRGDGRIGFRAPLSLHSYVKTLSLVEIMSRIDGTLGW